MSNSSRAILGAVTDGVGVVPYRPALNEITGSVTATILLLQIVYWWERNDRQPFFKFKEPCDHSLCRPTDSWTEELGLSRKSFDTALGKIGQRLAKNTKKDASKFVWYWTDIQRLTHYEINETLVESEFERVFTKRANGDHVKSQRNFTRRAKGTLDLQRLPPENTLIKENTMQRHRTNNTAESSKAKENTGGTSRLRTTLLPEDSPGEEEFEQWWKSWIGFCKEARLSRVAMGDKKSALSVWLDLIRTSSVCVEKITAGTQAYFRQARSEANNNRGSFSRPPHACRFLKGKVDHPTPYWLEALEYESEGPFIAPESASPQPLTEGERMLAQIKAEEGWINA